MPTPPNRPGRGDDILHWAHRVTDFLRTLRFTSGPGIRIQHKTTSVDISADPPPAPRGRPATHPFQLHPATTSGGDPALRVRAGTVGGEWPTIGGTPINTLTGTPAAPPLITPVTSGDIVLAIEIEPGSADVSPDQDGSAWEASGGELINLTLHTAADAPAVQAAAINADTGAVIDNGIWLLPIGTVDIDGDTITILAQSVTTSLWWKVCGRFTTLELLIGQA